MGEVALQLRPLQVRAVDMTHAAMRHHRRILLVAPTAAGKRYMLVWWCLFGAQRGRKVLVVTDRRTLVNQMADECTRHGVEFGIIMGNEPKNESALVQIASIQTLRRRKYQDMPEANLVAIDEGHKESAAYKQLFEMHANAKCIGVTATPVGAQGKSLIPGVYDVMVEGITNSQLFEENLLLRTECWTPSEPDLEGVKIESSGEYNQQELGERIQQCTVFADVFKWWKPYSDMQTICFSPRVKFAYGLAEQFGERGFSAQVIEAATKDEDRSEMFERFASRDLRVLISVDVLREGFDSTVAQCGIDLQPNYQFRTYWQKIGRIRRMHEGQDKAVWLDFAGNFWRFYHPDEDPDWSKVTDKSSIQDVIAERKGQKCPTCGAKAVYKGKCQKCGVEIPKDKTWSCPHCSYTLSPWERIHDGKCPNCGKAIGKAVRRVRMQDGSMRSVSAKQKEKKIASDSQKVWKQSVYRAFYARKKLSFARWLYHKTTDSWPSSDLEPKPPSSPQSGDWNRWVGDVYPHILKYAKRRTRK